MQRTSYYDSAVVPEVVVTIKKALRLEPGQLSVKSPSAGSSIAGRPSVTKTYRKTDKVVKAEKHVGHKTDRKTSALSQRGTSGKEPGRYGVMAAPKAVELDHLPSSPSQEDRPRKRLRLEDKHAAQRDNIKVVKSATQGHSTKKTERFTGKNAEHHTGKKHKFSTVTTMTTTTITKTTSATTSQIRSVTGHPHAAVSKHRLGIISLSKSPVRSTATSRSAAANAASEFTSRFRVKDRIDYRIKLALSLKTPGEPSNSKSKGKAIRKKITPSGGDAAVVKPRAPSPFPAWHLTTSALAKAGEVPEVDMKEVEGIPEDECYVFIPSKWFDTTHVPAMAAHTDAYH
ncbi:hypothetical protein QFC19_005467 [Naganishia cerealis]|uniref:Uncharacterized protein n=1 Tax=Naganishia cerealis TaxID=610337 RepID=A0ACC2VNR1_9TREE|nr:hypothetical protein QFC19_005467 [Naganishia cerealis]